MSKDKQHSNRRWSAAEPSLPQRGTGIAEMLNDPSKTFPPSLVSATCDHACDEIFRLLRSAGAEGLRLGVIARALKIAPHVLPTHLRHLTSANLVRHHRRKGAVVYMLNEAFLSDADSIDETDITRS